MTPAATNRTLSNLLPAGLLLAFCLGLSIGFPGVPLSDAQSAEATPPALDKPLKEMLDSPLLFVKRHPYMSGHIYDDYYTWHPGGGIYILDNPAAPLEEHHVRPIIDPTTNETLGEGVYRDPELSWDAKRIVFAYKPAAGAMTSIYEIGVDGHGLMRLTASDKYHDITPAYLPDGRIVFNSTRPKALVPCFNSGVDTLHVMNADGSDIQSISSNNVTEFDPAIMLDGRILYGRWEYVDKTALYMQSLWTMAPDGRMEEALFANNMAKPTALLDARPVPGTTLVVAALTPHNGQAVGAIAMIDPRLGKNNLKSITNFTPEYPTKMDQGLRKGPSDPWALSKDVVLMSNNAKGHGVIEIVDRFGHRELVHSDPDISCYSPMPIKPRPRPPILKKLLEEDAPLEPGRFLLTDVHRGLTGVDKGTIKRLRIVEETARTSGLPPGGRWWNQAFLVSWQGAYTVKNVLGVVPVHEDGSAYFEVPPGRAIYIEALDAEGREIQRMRTFVQSVPGTVRSCVGCHEKKNTASIPRGHVPMATQYPPARPEPESWGSGYVDYGTQVQPILDKYCVRCHGGEEGIEKGLDFSGGWTWAFNISYETLLKNDLVGFINCNNGSVHSSDILPPRTIGSGASPLAELLIEKHPERHVEEHSEMERADRDLLLAWMDTNSNYYGTWDYTQHATCNAILSAAAPLSAVMQKAGCTECHAAAHIGSDWINLQTPEWSRILRAPMTKANGLLGLAMCRQRKARTGYPLITQRVQPPDFKIPSRRPPWDPSGEVHTQFDSTDDPFYREMLSIIRRTRSEALARPRVDMPGAQVIGGVCRMQVPPPVPETPPALSAEVTADFAVALKWERTAETVGLQYELHRGEQPQFAIDAETQIGLTSAGRLTDPEPSEGLHYYALVVTSGEQHGGPVYTSIEVPQMPAPAAPTNLVARPLPGGVELTWDGPAQARMRFDGYRSQPGSEKARKLNAEPVAQPSFTDYDVETDTKYVYTIRAVDRRSAASTPSKPAEASPLKEIKEPVFDVEFGEKLQATLLDGKRVDGRLHEGAKLADGGLSLSEGGFATFAHLPEFDVARAISVECWLFMEKESPMPVILSCGAHNSTGWFLQQYQGRWRWHVAPTSCDGGGPALGRWTHLVGTFDGHRAHLYQDGKPVGSAACDTAAVRHGGPLVIGQYASQTAQYQTRGQLRGVKIYARVLRPSEVAAKFKSGAPK